MVILACIGRERLVHAVCSIDAHVHVCTSLLERCVVPGGTVLFPIVSQSYFWTSTHDQRPPVVLRHIPHRSFDGVLTSLRRRGTPMQCEQQCSCCVLS